MGERVGFVSVIHAAGVCFGLANCDGRCWGSGPLGLAEPLLELLEGFDFVSEIFEVSKIGGPGFGMGLEVEDLLDESAEVIERSHWRERWIIRIAIQATNGAKDESIFDDVERNVTLVKSDGQETVLPMSAP